MKKSPRIFISHTTADREQVRRLSRALSRHVSHVFTTDMISGGSNWQTTLRDELSQSDLFIVLLSPAALESDFVLHEVGAAWGMGKPVVAVTTGDPALSSQLPVDMAERLTLSLDKLLNEPATVRQMLEHPEGSAHAA